MTYIYRCSICEREIEVEHSMKEVNEPLQSTINLVTCHEIIMKRIPQLTLVNGITGKSSKELLKEKSDYMAKRSKAHTFNEGYKDIKDPQVLHNMRKKAKAGHYDDVKGLDHEKMKP
jgi:hypothetical protein